jgi:dethiobiotin synthetase
VSTVLVTGTETEVGKTWWGRTTIDVLRAAGVPVAARKPTQSYSPEELGATDAEVLAHASGEPAEVVCPRHRWYPVAMAPPMAADVLGLPTFTIGDLVAELVPPAEPSTITIVEGAGGPRSPLAADGDTVSLGAAIGADMFVLVAPAGLGTINAVRLATSALRADGPADARVLVALNRYDADDDLHRRNHGWLAGEGHHLVTSPAELAAELRRG